ncbi:MAG: efflux RND transporter periplasmic adaptor subunit [Burkholderiaceae bacterium]
MKKSRILGTSGLAAAAVLMSFAFESPQAQTRVESPRTVKLTASKKSAVNKQAGKPAPTLATSEFGCLIQPHASANVATSVPGVLSEVRVRRGDAVKKNQILAVLDSDVEQALLGAAAARAQTHAEIASAQATRDMARQKLVRMQSLNELSYGARLEIELAQGEVKVAEHRLQQARDRHKIAHQEHEVAARQLEQRYVRSPIEGVVADRLLNPGERADGRPIMRIIKVKQLRVEVVAPAEQFGNLSAGMFGTVESETAKPIALTAIVDQVDSFIDPASGTFRARMLVDNSDFKIPAGARCRVSFEPDASSRKAG